MQGMNLKNNKTSMHRNIHGNLIWMKKGPHTKPDKLRGLDGGPYKLRDQK